jgi:hypothetical protein
MPHIKIVSDLNYDELFRKWLDETKKKYDATDETIVSDCKDEIEEREDRYEDIKKLLESKELNSKPKEARNLLLKTLAKSSRMQHQIIMAQLTDFIKSENSFEQIKRLIDGPFDTHNIKNRIEEFIDKAAKSNKRGLPKNVAALLASEILTAVKPKDFVTYRTSWWNDFAKKLRVPITFSTKDCAKSIMDAADFAKKLSETETYRKLWVKTDYPHPNYVIPAILWRSRWWEVEGIGKKKKKTQKQLEKQLEREQEDLKKIGTFAEKVVEKEEKKELEKAGLYEEARRVKIISSEDAKAGYDIESFGKEGEERGKQIFIEVKSSANLQTNFFWTENEVTVARKEGEKYWLYFVRGVDWEKKTWLPPIQKIKNAMKIFEDPQFNKKCVKYHIIEKSG